VFVVGAVGAFVTIWSSERMSGRGSWLALVVGALTVTGLFGLLWWWAPGLGESESRGMPNVFGASGLALGSLGGFLMSRRGQPPRGNR